MSRKPRIVHKHVGLFVDEQIDALAADVASVRGTSKSIAYAAGVRALAESLSDEERKALEAIRTARRSAP